MPCGPRGIATARSPTALAKVTARYLRITTEAVSGLYGPVDTKAAIVIEPTCRFPARQGSAGRRSPLGSDTPFESSLALEPLSWDLNYNTGWAKRIEQFAQRWIEEPFHVDKLESFAALRRSASIPVAPGKHFYGRWELQRLLRAEASSKLTPNGAAASPNWSRSPRSVPPSMPNSSRVATASTRPCMSPPLSRP